MTYNMKKRNYILLLCILLCAAPLMAQDASENTKFPGWYVGLQGGVPFGVSQFSSAVSVSTRPVRDSAAEFMEATVSILYFLWRLWLFSGKRA